MNEKVDGDNKPANKAIDNDKELSDLLDSALEDFSNNKSSENGSLEKRRNADHSEDESRKSMSTIEVEGGNVNVTGDAEWTEEFIKHATAQFEQNITKLLTSEQTETSSSTENVHQSIQKMAEAAAQVASNPSQTASNWSSNNFANTISQTLQDLSAGASNLRSPFSEQDLLNMFGNQSNDEDNVFVPFMQGMMQSLLSKEVLYPSLKDLLDKYPSWLEENERSLPADQAEKYRKQQQLMGQVCVELETEKETDTDEQKKNRFEKVLTLMQKLQDYGQPPKELIGDENVNLPVPLNDMGMEQCAPM